MNKKYDPNWLDFSQIHPLTKSFHLLILHVINNLAKGGAEKLLVDSLPHFNATGIRVAVLLLTRKGSAPEYIQQLRDKDIPLHFLSEDSSVYNPLLILKLKNVIAGIGPDLVHVHLFPSMYWMALAKKAGLKVPLVFTEHSTQNRRFNNAVFKIADRFIYRQYARIIAISPAIKNKLIEWTGSTEPLRIVRNGVDTLKFSSASSYDRRDFLNSLGLSGEKTLLMMTARFAFPKDFKTIVDTIGILPDHYVALFVGDGNDKNEVQQYVKARNVENRVLFLGFRTDIPQLMKTVDINVLSSIYEGMSGVSCEAMASGKPFIGTDVPGINDVVPDERFLFAAKEPGELAAKVEHIQTDKDFSQRMVADGQAYVKNFDIAAMVNNTICIYRQVLNT